MLPEYLKLTIMVVGIWWEKYIFVVGRKKKDPTRQSWVKQGVVGHVRSPIHNYLDAFRNSLFTM